MESTCNSAPCNQPSKFKCGRCKKARYCSQDCQKKDWKDHKVNCSKASISTPCENYLIRVQLEPKEIIEQPIIRTISCPANATFHQLHQALQIAFGWATTHTYDFKIKDPSEADRPQPDLMERLMAAQGQDLAQFNPYGDPDSIERYLLRLVEEKKTQPSSMGPGFGAIDAMHDPARRNRNTPHKFSSKVRLFEVFDEERFQNVPWEYEYDFGDCWEHDIVVVGRLPKSNRFEVIEGQGHCAAEDVGSRRGWKRLCKAYQARSPTKDQKEQMTWYQTQCSNGDRRGLGGGRIAEYKKEVSNAMLSRLTPVE